MNQVEDFAHGALLQCADGKVVLSLHDSHYAADDMLPPELQGPTAREPAHARRFVNACMIIEYGRDEHVWPELARRFVSGG
ncbi:MAG TPA: hypothetical protein VHB46_06495 [Burkholderiales bacterium]|nr:hypothetical protein [Burkholderiales bacterium]